MKDAALKHGAFGWFELMTTDAEAAKQFYTQLFGWETMDYPMEGMTYTVLKVNDDETGGIMSIPAEAKGMPPMWSLYITVADVDATAQQVEKLGGTVIRPPMDIPKVGRFCVLQDPQGAMICAITYAEQPK